LQHLDLLTDIPNRARHLEDFNEELDKILAMHRYIVAVSLAQFSDEYDRLMARPGDGSYDGGDAIWDAEQTIGVTPWDVASHAGLMAVTRAVSLTEVTLARMAASAVSEPEVWVFPNGLLWFREWERSFYKTVPLTPFNTDSNGFGALRDLRDLYSHGYGIPTTDKRRETLARKLYNQFDTGSITAAESGLGYTGEAYFFGDSVEFDKKTNTLKARWLMAKRADISPLATFRVLEAIRGHVTGAHTALARGLKEELTAESSRFVKIANLWWDNESKKTS
jgi:hypothetical protein